MRMQRRQAPRGRRPKGCHRLRLRLRQRLRQRLRLRLRLRPRGSPRARMQSRDGRLGPPTRARQHRTTRLRPSPRAPRPTAAPSGAAPPQGRVPSTQPPAPPSISFFQIGASALIRSIASRAPANASSRWPADTATSTLGCDSGTNPTRCSAATATSPCRCFTSARIVAIFSSAISAYASYSSASTERVIPSKTTTAPAAGLRTKPASASIESGSSVTRTCTSTVSPPLTGGTSASSSLAESTSSACAYSRFTAITTGTPAVTSASESIASRTRAPSGSSSVTSDAPARSRSIAKSFTVTSTICDATATMAQYPLQGRTLFIPGGASGIGAETARQAAAKGARLALVDVNGDAARRMADSLPEAIGITADVRDYDSLEAAVQETVSTFGGIDICFANAGIEIAHTARAVPLVEMERLADINFTGAMRTLRAALPAVIDSRGYVLITASLAAIMHAPPLSHYTASKAGVEAFGNAVRMEVRHKGVDVGVAYFAVIDTPMVGRAYEDPVILQFRDEAERQGGRMRDWLTKTYPVGGAGAAVIKGMETRGRRVMHPRPQIRFLQAIRSLMPRIVERSVDPGLTGRMADALDERDLAGTGDPSRDFHEQLLS